jgi:hypothetical protein
MIAGASGIIPAIIPQAVPAANKTGTGTVFVLQQSPTINTPTITSPTVTGQIAATTSAVQMPPFLATNTFTTNASYVWTFNGLAPNISPTGGALFLLGKDTSTTNNSAYFAFVYAGSGLTTNRLTFGFLNNDNVFNVYATGRLAIATGATAPVSTLDVGGGMSIGTYAGVNAPPTNGMVISGGIGIGKTSVTSGFLLDVANPIQSTSSAVNTAPVTVTNTFTSSGSYTWVYNGMAPNISPTAGALMLVGHDTGTTNNAAYFGFIYQGGSGSTTNRATISFVNNDGLFTFRADGRLGINQIAPTTALDVNGTVHATGYQSSDGSAGVTVSACTSFKNGLCVAGT